jgi:hypothetical protein
VGDQGLEAERGLGELRDSLATPLPQRLTDRQQRLLGALQDRNELLGTMYLSGVALLDLEALPEHPVIVAHIFRELMDKLPKSFDLPVRQSIQLRVRVRELAQLLEHAKTDSRAHDGANWIGEIDDPLRGFLSEIDALFRDAEADLQSRRDAATAFLRSTESSAAPSPLVIERRQLAKWNELERFFQGVSHHGRSVAHRELEDNVGDLEALLMSRLKLFVIEEYEEIDRLIEQGEAEHIA